METNVMSAEAKKLMDSLISTAKSETKSNNSSVHSHNYSLYYDLIISGAMNENTVNLASYNFLYNDIKKMSKIEYCELKSTFDAQKKIRRFFQNYAIKTSKTKAEQQKKSSDFLQSLVTLHNLLTKKEETKK